MLLRVDPFRSFGNTTRKMFQMMDEFDKSVNFDIGSFKPRVDISEDSGNLYVVAELPGVAKEDVKISINEENILVIKGEKKESIGENNTSHRNERALGVFERRFILPDNLAHDKVEAVYDNGLLRLTIAKVEPPKPKEVEISIS